MPTAPVYSAQVSNRGASGTVNQSLAVARAVEMPRSSAGTIFTDIRWATPAIRADGGNAPRRSEKKLQLIARLSNALLPISTAVLPTQSGADRLCLLPKAEPEGEPPDLGQVLSNNWCGAKMV